MCVCVRVTESRATGNGGKNVAYLAGHVSFYPCSRFNSWDLKIRRVPTFHLRVASSSTYRRASLLLLRPVNLRNPLPWNVEIGIRLEARGSVGFAASSLKKVVNRNLWAVQLSQVCRSCNLCGWITFWNCLMRVRLIKRSARWSTAFANSAGNTPRGITRDEIYRECCSLHGNKYIRHHVELPQKISPLPRVLSVWTIANFAERLFSNPMISRMKQNNKFS